MCIYVSIEIEKKNYDSKNSNTVYPLKISLNSGIALEFWRKRKKFPQCGIQYFKATQILFLCFEIINQWVYLLNIYLLWIQWIYFWTFKIVLSEHNKNTHICKIKHCITLYKNPLIIYNMQHNQILSNLHNTVYSATLQNAIAHYESHCSHRLHTYTCLNACA